MKEHLSDKQVRALNLWCRQCCKVLNDTGHFRCSPMDYRKQFKWVEKNGINDFKHYIYKPFLASYKGKTSTMDQDSSEPSEIYLALCGHFASEYNIQLPPWPSLR